MFFSERAASRGDATKGEAGASTCRAKNPQLVGQNEARSKLRSTPSDVGDVSLCEVRDCPTYENGRVHPSAEVCLTVWGLDGPLLGGGKYFFDTYLHMVAYIITAAAWS